MPRLTTIVCLLASWLALWIVDRRWMELGWYRRCWKGRESRLGPRVVHLLQSDPKRYYAVECLRTKLARRALENFRVSLRISNVLTAELVS
jgi:hypothetical protein